MSTHSHAAGGLLLAALVAVACGPAHRPYTPTPEETAWDGHHAAENAGDTAAAEEGYRSMCEAEEPYQRACYDLARMLFDTGREDEARLAAAAYIAGDPEGALAPVAAKRLGRSFADAGEWDAGITELERLAAEVKGSDAADTLLYEVARLNRKAGRIDGEAAALARLVDGTGRWESQLWDNAIWRLCEIRREQGDHAAEKKRLRQFLDTREKARVLGSYASPYHDDALLRLGQLKLEQGRLGRAAELFDELAAMETSRLRDDGLLWGARARLEKGNEGKACRLLRRAVRIPAASAARSARELAATVPCPGHESW